MEWVIALIALAAMEIVLGIDNIVFIAIVTAKLPRQRQTSARRIGLLIALGLRILLLTTLSWIIGLSDPIIRLTDIGIPATWLAWGNGAGAHDPAHIAAINEISWRDVILVAGGLFLLWNSVREIHGKIEGKQEIHGLEGSASFVSVLVQIGLLDIIFSLDSVITAIGMAEDLRVMIAAVIIAVFAMILFADPVSNFVTSHPTLKMLALSFLILIGVMLVAEGIGTHINKGYIYFAMAFAFLVEMLNLRVRGIQNAIAPA